MQTYTVSIRKSAIVILSEAKNLLQKKNYEILPRPAICGTPQNDTLLRTFDH